MKRILFIFAVVINALEAANILAVFPTPSISHQVVFRALTDALEDRGHTLTIVSTDPGRLSRHHPNTTEIDLHFSYEVFHQHFNVVKAKEGKFDEIDFFKMWVSSFESVYKAQFEYPDITKLLQSRGNVKYDVVIVEYLIHYSWFALAEWFDAPLIGITSLDALTAVHETFGNEANPMIHPDVWFPFSSDLTFFQRYQSLRYYLWYNYFFIPKFSEMNEEVVRRYMPGVTSSFKELGNKGELLMTNTHPALGYIRPLVPTTIQLGFMHIKPPKPIVDESLINFLDTSDKPIIYMSLGTNAKSSEMNENFLNVFLNVFKTLPFNVLWKWETDSMKNKPDNVFIHKWLPQADLLAHPKIKLYIMQGGQQSLEEAIDRGVPLVVIPFMGDQESNAKKIKKMKIGVSLGLHSLSEQSLRTAINEVVKGEYKQNILKLREVIHDQPMKPTEKAVWWVEYCIRHKGMKHLDYSGKYVPFYQRYMLDFIGITFVVLIATLKILSLIGKFVFGGKKVKRE